MNDAIRVRARITDGVVIAYVLMPHPMETGFRHDEAGLTIEAHCIREVLIEVAGRRVATARLGIGVSADPLLTFRFRGASAGERITVTWTDDRGEARSGGGTIA